MLSYKSRGRSLSSAIRPESLVVTGETEAAPLAAIGIAVDDGRYSVVRAERQKFGLELVTLTDIDPVDVVIQPEFLKRNGNLVPVRSRSVMEFNHVVIQYMRVCRRSWFKERRSRGCNIETLISCSNMTQGNKPPVQNGNRTCFFYRCSTRRPGCLTIR